jgi:hypothetical protein
MADKNPSRAIDSAKRIVWLGDFMETPEIKTAYERLIPVSMPALVGSLGVDVPLWVGLGTVGLWASLDAFADRADLPRNECEICKRRCVRARFLPYVRGDEAQTLGELDDIRNLYAHNHAGQADNEYFAKRRHVLASGVVVPLTCGAAFNGQQLLLDFPNLRFYSTAVQTLLQRENWETGDTARA